MNKKIIYFAIFCLFWANCPIYAAEVYLAHTRAELVSEYKTLKPGMNFLVGLRMRMDPEWHVYWKNPGDSGLPPKITWQLPEGFSAGEIQWPYPKRINIEHLTVYGYEDEVLFFIPFKIGEEAAVGDAVLKARADWLACKVDCIPAQAELSLALPVQEGPPQPDLTRTKDFQKTVEKLPLSAQTELISAYGGDDQFILRINIPSVSDADDIYFFPDKDNWIQHAAQQNLTKKNWDLYLAVPKSNLLKKNPERLSGVIVAQEKGFLKTARAFSFDAGLQEGLPAEYAKPSVISGRPLSLWAACLFAFLGGLILNLMPCVLPVLTIKILALIEEGASRPGQRRRNGIIFTLGVMVSFWILAGLLAALKLSGQKIGWGFQFQSPYFVAGMAQLFFLLALNLMGIFEIGASLTRLGNIKNNFRGDVAHFLSGVLAAVVATPCTAPFMGVAVGYALAQSLAQIFLVFTCLALGMAFPFLVLVCFPGALKFIPKPGAWMVILKIAFGFVLMVCVIWLVWVLGMQKGLEAVIALLAGFLFAAMGAWGYWYLQGKTTQKAAAQKILALSLIILGWLVSFYWAKALSPISRPMAAQGEENLPWQDFSGELLAKLRREEKPVLVDFTAAWCLTCQVNERLVFRSKDVIAKLESKGIILLKADWTNRSEEITRALAAFGRSSIPLYVLYSSDSKTEPLILPEIITPSIMLEALEKTR